MKLLQYTVRFVTPAFLGNAEQNGQWRTPPFKALIRQWWRAAYAAQKNFNVDVSRMLAEENCIFGAAAGDRGSRSLVRIRLDQWEEGKLKAWQPLGTASQPYRIHGEGRRSRLYRLLLSSEAIRYDTISADAKQRTDAAEPES